MNGKGKVIARNQMEVPDEFLKFYDDPEHFAGAPGGESFAEVKERTDDFLNGLYGQEEYEVKIFFWSHTELRWQHYSII